MEEDCWDLVKRGLEDIDSGLVLVSPGPLIAYLLPFWLFLSVSPRGMSAELNVYSV